MDLLHFQELGLKLDALGAKLDGMNVRLDQIILAQTTFNEKGEKFMASAAQALIDLQNAVNTLVAGQTNLAAGLKALQAADAAIDAALATLEGEVSGETGVSAAAVEAVVAQLNTASTALAAANTSVGTVVTDLNTQVSKAGSGGSGITVVVSPATEAMGQGEQQQFTATGDPSGYVWSLNPASGAGIIDQTGLYSSPAGANGTVQVIATSVTDNTKAGSAAVTFNASNATAVTVSPTAQFVAQGATAQFTAVVTGDSSNAVVWSVTPATGAGSISPTGLYTPPTTAGGSAQVTATSVANPQVAGNAAVTF
jgi:hypothetical protein